MEIQKNLTIYKTVIGHLRQTSITISAASFLDERIFNFTEVEAIIKRGCDIHFLVPPELNKNQIPLLMPVIEIEPPNIHFMVRAFEYRTRLKERHRNCVKTCMILLRVAPFEQKDLRRWWVRNMVLPTWHNNVWEKNAERGSSPPSLEGAKDCN